LKFHKKTLAAGDEWLDYLFVWISGERRGMDGLRLPPSEASPV
jgi:hypothetical protein